jgi:hypothetical protein
MDSSSIYAVQAHEARLDDFTELPNEINLAIAEYHDVLVWDFSKNARKCW